MDCGGKVLHFLDGVGYFMVLHRKKRLMSLRFILSQKMKHCLRKGCQMFSVTTMNEGD
jgi:hypothetical protein